MRNLYLVTETARAIHDDFSIPDALPALAEILDRSDLEGEPLIRRAINANFRVGRPVDAERLARYASNLSAPENMRTTALACLALWAQPPVLDAVEGRYREYPARKNSLGQCRRRLSEECIAKQFSPCSHGLSKGLKRSSSRCSRRLRIGLLPAISVARHNTE